MKLRISTGMRIAISFLAVMIFFFGFFGFFLGSSYSTGDYNSGKYFKQHPLNEKNGIAADSFGNIYIGETETGSIQVYDPSGRFKYGFSFPTGGSGWFAFGIEQNKVHVITARTDSYFVFSDGELIYSESIGNDRSDQLQARYNMNEDSKFTANNKIYEISAFNTVTIRDLTTGLVEKVHINTPIWPFPVFVFWIIGFLGAVILLMVNNEFLKSLQINK
jgi:hypothetical protein